MGQKFTPRISCRKKWTKLHFTAFHKHFIQRQMSTVVQNISNTISIVRQGSTSSERLQKNANKFSNFKLQYWGLQSNEMIIKIMILIWLNQVVKSWCDSYMVKNWIICGCLYKYSLCLLNGPVASQAKVRLMSSNVGAKPLHKICHFISLFISFYTFF